MTEAEPLGGRYKIISQLGAGGFGQTFLAEDLHLPGHPRCVVKHLKPQTKEDGTLSMARRLFDTEAKVLYQLEHDQIPRLLAHFEHNQEFYLAQELVEGEPLTHELTGGIIWSEGQVIGLLQDILEILAFVHEQQVIHRDIKPPNLMRRRCDGKIVLIDFGAVKLSTQIADLEHQTNITVSIGTQGYMPNEQLAGSPRFSSDVYAVGMLAIQALVGVHPKRLKENLSTGEIEWREQADNISSELADILDQMIRYDFRDRYPTASDALLAINHLPPELLESVPAYQPLPYEVKDKYQYQTETTKDSEILVTNPWTPVDPSAATEIDVEVNPTANTSPLSEPEPIQTPTNLEVTSATSELKERKFVSTKLWIVSGVSGVFATGAAILIGKNLLPQHFFASMVNPVEIPAKSPIVATTPSPVASPRKLSATELLDEAEGFRKAGDFSQALAKYDQAIALKPKVAKAYWGRCYTLNKLNRPAEAVVSCNDALDINPDYAEALWSKAQAFDKQKLTLEALQLYEEVTLIKPDFMEGWLSYGISLQGYGRSEEALIALERAIDLNRNSAEAWAVRGEAELNMGRIEKAVSSLNKALQLKPDNPKVLKLRKQAQEQLGL